MHPVLFTLPGGFQVYGYGFMLSLGILAAVFGATASAERDGIPRTRLYDYGLMAFFGGVLGGRLEYVRTHWAEKFAAHPMNAFDLRDGGYVFYGGLVVAALGCVAITRYHKLVFAKVADHIAPWIGVGIGSARIGCFLVGCCYGCPTDLPWAVTFPVEAIAPEGIARHPTQLYESAFSYFVLFAGLSLYRIRFRRFEGEVLALFGVLYGIWRIFVESLRCDGERGMVLGGLLSNGQFTSLFIILIAALWGVAAWRNARLAGRPTP